MAAAQPHATSSLSLMACMCVHLDWRIRTSFSLVLSVMSDNVCVFVRVGVCICINVCVRNKQKLLCTFVNSGDTVAVFGRCQNAAGGRELCCSAQSLVVSNFNRNFVLICAIVGAVTQCKCEISTCN